MTDALADNEAASAVAHGIAADMLRVAGTMAVPDMEMADACLSAAFTLVRRHAASDTEAAVVLMRALNNGVARVEPARH